MGCCNEPVTALEQAPSDPSQHVHFAKGMVLGVDDFNQEFAYLAGRAEWLAHDALGYGTLNGLRVFAKAGGPEGPQLQVTAGSALVPGGKLVCVPSHQCAVLNKWLAKPENAALVNRLLNPASPPTSPPSVSSPPVVTSGRIALYLSLCFDDCLTRPVPIPGEPCRSDDQLMAPSRVADDYRLELRETPPAQLEEDAVRDFIKWLKTNLHVGGAASPPAADEAAWLEAMRAAIRPWLDAETASPPLSPPATFETLGDFLFDVSPPGLIVAPDQLCDLLRVALRFWVTELRPRWIAMRCHRPTAKDTSCVLLARIELDVAWVGGSPAGVWQVVGSPASITVDESRRPILAHLRLLQEWLLCGCGCGHGGAAGGGAPYAPGGADVDVEDGGTGMSTPPADGEVLIGDGGSYVLAKIAGTPDEITVTTGPGTISIAAPTLGPAGTPQFAGLRTTGAVHSAVAKTAANLALDDTHHVLLGDGTITISLPKCGAANLGRQYVIKNVGNTPITLECDAADFVEGKKKIEVKKLNAATVVSDGVDKWHVIATVA